MNKQIPLKYKKEEFIGKRDKIAYIQDQIRNYKQQTLEQLFIDFTDINVDIESAYVVINTPNKGLQTARTVIIKNRKCIIKTLYTEVNVLLLNTDEFFVVIKAFYIENEKKFNNSVLP